MLNVGYGIMNFYISYYIYIRRLSVNKNIIKVFFAFYNLFFFC